VSHGVEALESLSDAVKSSLSCSSPVVEKLLVGGASEVFEMRVTAPGAHVVQETGRQVMKYQVEVDGTLQVHTYST